MNTKEKKFKNEFLEERQGETMSSNMFAQILNLNADNEKISDEEFRRFIRATLPVVTFPR